METKQKYKLKATWKTLALILAVVFAFDAAYADSWTADKPSHSTLYVDTLTSKTDNSAVNIADLQGLFVTGDVTTLGRVGIGTTSPSNRLDIQETAGMTSATIRLSDVDDNEAFGIVPVANSGNGKLYIMARSGYNTAFSAATDAKLTIQQNGNVGIGTINPSQKIESVVGNGAVAFRALGSVAGRTIDLIPDASGADDGDQLIRSGAGDFIFQVLNTDGDFKFRQSTASPLMTIEGTGSVGIGTSSPLGRLHLAGDSRPEPIEFYLQSSQNGDESYKMIFRKSRGSLGALTSVASPDPLGSIFFQGYTGATWQRGAAITAMVESGVGAGADLPTALLFSTTPDGSGSESERMRITSAGNIGIGTASPDNPLEVRGVDNGIKISSASNNRPHFILENGASLMLDISANNEQVEFNSQGSTVMAFKSGNVGIGNTAPETNLHVTTPTTGSTAIKISSEDNDARLIITTTGQQDWNVGVDRSDSGKFMVSRSQAVGTNAYVTVDTSGKVGIGTTSPGDLLEIAQGTELQVNAKVSNDDPTNYAYWTGSRSRGTLAAPTIVQNSDLITSFLGRAYNGAGTWAGVAQIRFSVDGDTGATDLPSRITFHTAPDGSYNLQERMRIDNQGNVGIGTTSPGYKLDVAGDAHATSFPTSSDVRLKKNITPITNALEKLQNINGVYFEWNDKYKRLGRATNGTQIGLIAQDVEKEFPELVTTWGNESYKAVDYGRLTGVLVEAIKELKKENEELKADNAELQSRLKKLEAKIK